MAMEATARENYDNPAFSTGLTIGSIFTDYETQLLANRKQVFLNATMAADFKMSVYSQLEAYNNANREASRKAFEEARIFAENEIKRAYNEGKRRVDENIKEYERQGYKAKEITSSTNNRLPLAIANTLGSLAGALLVGNQSANQQILQITSIVNTDAENLEREIDDKQKIFLQKGISGSYNKNGIATEVSAVAELQMRQDSQKTLLEAQGDRSAEYGLYLIQISAHPSSCPLCTPWQARVLVDDVYKGGKADGEHELLSTAIEAGLFHYNCRHSYIVYIPGYSRDNIFDYDKASKKLTAERYAIEQEQRRNERAIREWKRIEQGSLSDKDKMLAHKRVQEWQARQRALEKYAEEKRIPFYRQYQREAIGGDTKPTLPKITQIAQEQGINPGGSVAEEKWQNTVDSRLKQFDNLDDKQREIKRMIVNGDIPTYVNDDKQNAHIVGTMEYNRRIQKGDNPSVITYSNPQELVNNFAGYGEILLRDDGTWKRQEIVAIDEIIGYTINKTGKIVETNQIKIHYSKSGVHIVPYSGE